MQLIVENTENIKRIKIFIFNKWQQFGQKANMEKNLK